MEQYIVERKSTLTGRKRQWPMPITEQELQRWKDGELIQDVFPHLTTDEREFIVSGITPDEWDAEFGDDSDY